jgi:hypothetical protein
MLIFSVCIFVVVQTGLYFMEGTKDLFFNLALSALFSLTLSSVLAVMLHHTDKNALQRVLSWCQARVQKLKG